MATAEERPDDLESAMTRALLILSLLLWTALCPSCRESRSEDWHALPAIYPESTRQYTNEGRQVVVPEWLDRDPALRAEAFEEIDTLVPMGWVVVIHDPGSYGILSSPTGLARGHVDFARLEIHVAFRFRPCEDRPLLPALEHEVGHVTGGPFAGH